MTCLCGLSFPAQHLTQHRRSRTHRVALTLQAVKDRASVWWPEVATKHRVSSELVRQIAKRLGIDAKARHAECRRLRFLQAHQSALVVRAARWLRSKGLRVEFELLRPPAGRGERLSTARLRVEGKLVRISHSGRRRDGRYIRLFWPKHAPAEKPVAYMWCTPAGWLVMRPTEIHFKVQSCVSLAGDYMQYLNRWQILRKRQP